MYKTDGTPQWGPLKFSYLFPEEPDVGVASEVIFTENSASIPTRDPLGSYSATFTRQRDSFVLGTVFVGHINGVISRHYVNLGPNLDSESTILSLSAAKHLQELEPSPVKFLQHSGAVTNVDFATTAGIGGHGVLATYGGSVLKLWNGKDGHLLYSYSLQQLFRNCLKGERGGSCINVELKFLRSQYGALFLGVLMSSLTPYCREVPFVAIDCSEVAKAVDGGCDYSDLKSPSLIHIPLLELSSAGSFCGLVIRQSSSKKNECFSFLRVGSCGSGVSSATDVHIVSVDPTESIVWEKKRSVAESGVCLEPLRLSFTRIRCASPDSITLRSLLGVENRLLGVGDRFAVIECSTLNQMKLMVLERRWVSSLVQNSWDFVTSVGPFEGDARGHARTVHLETGWLNEFSDETTKGLFCLVEKSGASNTNKKYVTAVDWN